MTRDQFIHHMDTVQAYLDQCNALSKALQQHLANDSMATHITLGADMLGAYLDLIEEAVGDGPFAPGESYSSWVRWYLWEAKYPTASAPLASAATWCRTPARCTM